MTAAQLFVTDIKTSCDFFTQKLGFSIVFVYGEPPFYAQVKEEMAPSTSNASTIPSLTPHFATARSLLSADMGVDTHDEIKRSSLNLKQQASLFFRR